MKCIYCGTDSKFTDRADGRCKCGKKFAFEPKNGDPYTDRGFQSAIEAVSAKGQIRWGVEHLYYELCRRRLRKRMFAWKVFVISTAVLPVLLLLAGRLPLSIFALLAWLVILSLSRRYRRPPTVNFDQATFDGLWRRWVAAHGNPPALIVRNPARAVSRPQESDIGDYSFDRAVICDRARTVDLLIANNFHFENSCAVLSIGGYPRGPFDTVRTMLKRNPKLQVFALHDASLEGCQLADALGKRSALVQRTGPGDRRRSSPTPCRAVPRSVRAAFKWLRRAAGQGHQRRRADVVECLHSGTGRDPAGAGAQATVPGHQSQRGLDFGFRGFRGRGHDRFL